MFLAGYYPFLKISQKNANKRCVTCLEMFLNFFLFLGVNIKVLVLFQAVN